MAYIDFEDTKQGQKERKEFWLSDDGLTLIEQWKREGVANDEIAIKYIGTTSSTFWRWSKQCPKLEELLYRVGDVVNSKVESALLKRALGYEYNEETWELVEGEMRKTKVMVKHVSPDTKAALAWLYSRRPDRWRAQQDPLESTEYVNTVKKILVSMKEVANSDGDLTVDVDANGISTDN